MVIAQKYLLFYSSGRQVAARGATFGLREWVSDGVKAPTHVLLKDGKRCEKTLCLDI